jgi:hypothetical protein
MLNRNNSLRHLCVNYRACADHSQGPDRATPIGGPINTPRSTIGVCAVTPFTVSGAYLMSGVPGLILTERPANVRYRIPIFAGWAGQRDSCHWTPTHIRDGIPPLSGRAVEGLRRAGCRHHDRERGDRRSCGGHHYRTTDDLVHTSSLPQSGQSQDNRARSSRATGGTPCWSCG